MKDLSFAIIGAGPSGMYAADALLKNNPDASVFIFDSLYAPYGLVRSGVAPDHNKIKEVTKLFDKTFAKEQVSFLGNVHIGKDISVEELRSFFHAIIFCTGAHKDRSLGIEGEHLTHVCNATSFVGWYNVHPWFQDFRIPFNKKKVHIIGQGNVAVDVARVLLKNPKELESTDINPDVLEKLKSSEIRDVHMVGRRGPLQAAFTDKELKELGELEDVYVSVKKEDLILSEEERAYLENAPKTLKANYEILKNLSEKPFAGQSKTLSIRFFLSPVRFDSVDGETVSSVTFCVNLLSGDVANRKAVPTDKQIEEHTDIILKSIGYRGEQIDSLPWDDRKGTFSHEHGLISDGTYQLYTSGWIKRGPSGVIGTNKADSVETVQTVISHIEKLPPITKSIKELYELLSQRGVRVIHFNDWVTLNKAEMDRGEGIKPRVKFNSNAEALSYLEK